MNTKILAVIGIVVVVLAAGGAAYYFFVHPASTSSSGQTVTSSGNPFATTGSNTNTGSSGDVSSTSNPNAGVTTISDTNGTPVVVKNFKSSPSVVSDPNNAGVYYLAGGVQEQQSKAPYQIFYSQTGDSFGITIYSEPFGKYRMQAEQELMADLGITQSEMCNLNYYISAGPGLSDIYSQENLGFSFCPGAVTLPQ